MNVKVSGAFRQWSGLLCVLLMSQLLWACAPKVEPELGQIRDLRDFPQNAFAYVPPSGEDALFLPLQRQRAYGEGFVRRWYAPWDRRSPGHDAESVNWGFAAYGKKRLFGENTLPRSQEWMEELRANADMGSYPNLGRPAIAVKNTGMRVLPTDEPAFYDFSLAGEGYPFDYMQNSGLWAATPLYAVHVSRDGAWVLCESPFTYGWVPVDDLAFVDEAFMDEWRGRELVAFRRDGVPVRDEAGLFRFKGRIGMLLPLARDGGVSREVMIPVRNAEGMAEAAYAAVPYFAADSFPLLPTYGNAAMLINEIMGQPYGWGGLFGKRDCSATTQDIFASFGILLPRNSRRQAQVGRYIDLSALGLEDKEAAILKEGIPFLTLVHLPGHVMLYLGEHDGRAAVFHTYWGVKTEDGGGREGRFVVGRSVVTGLSPGLELKDVRLPEGDLRYQIRGMAFPAEEEEDGQSL